MHGRLLELMQQHLTQWLVIPDGIKMQSPDAKVISGFGQVSQSWMMAHRCCPILWGCQIWQPWYGLAENSTPLSVSERRCLNMVSMPCYRAFSNLVHQPWASQCGFSPIVMGQPTWADGMQED
jgi:hypothetical protein